MAARSRLNAIQGLRAVAFAAIFISHAGTGNYDGLGAFGVAVFFVMSGFLMMLNYLQKETEPLCGVRFAFGKIKKLYPLHIVMMLFAAGYYLCSGFPALSILRDMGIHTLLVQMWIPHTQFYTTLNGPSWYLCACFFLYLCFPPLLRLFKKRMTKRRAVISLFVLFAAVVAVGAVNHIFGVQNVGNWFNAQWATYYFPPARFLDFAFGCVMGYLFLHRPPKPKKVTLLSTIMELLAAAAVVVALVIYAKKWGILGAVSFRFTTLFVPVSALLLWLVASERGALSFVLSLKPLVWLGNLSPYAFLIHGVVLRYCRNLRNPSTEWNTTQKWLVALLAFAITLVLSLLWERLTAALAQKKNAKNS